MATKNAKIVDARALTIVCEECDECCEDEYGSTMITDDSKTVTCRHCGAEYEIPANAFHVVCRAKCKAVE
jgi:hypothetical protein